MCGVIVLLIGSQGWPGGDDLLFVMLQLCILEDLKCSELKFFLLGLSVNYSCLGTGEKLLSSWRCTDRTEEFSCFRAQHPQPRVGSQKLVMLVPSI